MHHPEFAEVHLIKKYKKKIAPSNQVGSLIGLSLQLVIDAF
jgi:hypothetical protein